MSFVSVMTHSSMGSSSIMEWCGLDSISHGHLLDAARARLRLRSLLAAVLRQGVERGTLQVARVPRVEARRPTRDGQGDHPDHQGDAEDGGAGSREEAAG